LYITAAATIPRSAISGNITGNAADVTATVAVASGRTGATTLSGLLLGASTRALAATLMIPVGNRGTAAVNLASHPPNAAWATACTRLPLVI
jgi:hypothetical protein